LIVGKPGFQPRIHKEQFRRKGERRGGQFTRTTFDNPLIRTINEALQGVLDGVDGASHRNLMRLSNNGIKFEE
jgi:hypothetical protein